MSGGIRLFREFNSKGNFNLKNELALKMNPSFVILINKKDFYKKREREKLSFTTDYIHRLKLLIYSLFSLISKIKFNRIFL